MPMYYPDLKSVQNCCKLMSNNQKSDKKYLGIIPKNESELPRARRQLGAYFRDVWGDSIAAIEVEQAATKENYDQVISKGLFYL